MTTNLKLPKTPCQVKTQLKHLPQCLEIEYKPAYSGMG